MFDAIRLPRRTCLLGLLGLLLAAATAGARAESASGSGKPGTETRAVDGYHGIALKAPFKVLLRASGREGVTLRGDDNLLALVETRVVEARAGQPGPVLELRWRDGVRVSPRGEMLVTVDVVNLRLVTVAGSGEVSGDAPPAPSLALRVAGSGDIALRQVRTDDLAIGVAGSGDVKVAGRATKLAVTVSGSGDVDTDALEADEVAVQVAGSGDAAVTARKSLTVAIAGSGEVVHRGEAQPQVSVAGSGHVRRR
ncbi:head GIN domain-containing protein [uncultured Methylibium sp.]|uniref:head GIN domain-containing protein n=1 Tax=uncultured Methylibium sp. TaxID=381093 RepID=UPI0025FA75E7|nr:head GIN domain-containing protein [uncultured Methylibium sp.]